MWPLMLLVGSNVFMTIAWYGHLRFKGYPFWLMILISWLIALPEYALQVPANRLLYGRFSATQLKIFTEAISIAAFVIFGYFVLSETPSWRTGLAFFLIFSAVILAATDRSKPPPEPEKALVEDATN